MAQDHLFWGEWTSEEVVGASLFAIIVCGRQSLLIPIQVF